MPEYNYMCPEHGVFSEVRSIEDRQQAWCPECGEVCEKTLIGMKFNIMNHALPDGNGRFSGLKEQMQLKKLKAEARAKGDIASAKTLDKEIKKI